MLHNLDKPKISSIIDKMLYNYVFTFNDIAKGELDKGSHRFVTISSTAPNFEVWPRARAAWPSKASSKHEIQYVIVQYLGWKLMKCNETAARITRV